MFCFQGKRKILHEQLFLEGTKGSECEILLRGRPIISGCGFYYLYHMFRPIECEDGSIEPLSLNCQTREML